MTAMMGERLTATPFGNKSITLTTDSVASVKSRNAPAYISGLSRPVAKSECSHRSCEEFIATRSIELFLAWFMLAGKAQGDSVSPISVVQEMAAGRPAQLLQFSSISRSSRRAA